MYAGNKIINPEKSFFINRRGFDENHRNPFRPLYRRFIIKINYDNFYVDGAIDVMLISVQAGDRKGGAIDVFIQCRKLVYWSIFTLI